MKYLLIIFILIFNACSIKNYKLNESKIFIIKSPQLKFSDLGYLRSSDDSVELELFIAGKPIQKIEINHLICVNEGCMSKSSFNEEYLCESYPDDLLQNILLGRAIYNSKNMNKKKNSFTQTIKNESVDIRYEVSSKMIFFKDKTNNIIIKIKKVNNEK
ncbi:hypothetical protein GJV85_02000 [Sulfurimonas aquatica]|uniref:Lipoprotein n=1 Tax=Sulfurimonas aquatica TaxID=2672570 RepID=A0A975AYL0_9BACT|nr:hypothetical protein [Sulfurimonas aquatica]QSZ40934.1 hypothetical protein GJV85_02000 [Sulfurimonas aquatica]